MPRKVDRFTKEYLMKLLKDINGKIDAMIKNIKSSLNKEELERFERHEKIREKLLAKKVKKLKNKILC